MGAFEEMTLLEAEVPLVERAGLAAAVRAYRLLAPSYCERLHPQSRLLDSEWVSSAEDAPVGVQGIIQLVRSRRRATLDAWVQVFLSRTVMREQASMTVVVESLKEAARADGILALGPDPAPAAVVAVGRIRPALGDCGHEPSEH